MEAQKESRKLAGGAIGHGTYISWPSPHDHLPSSRCSLLTRFPQTQKDLPSQFLAQNTSLTSSILLASFGSSTGYPPRAFTLTPASDSSTPAAAGEKPIRYGALPEIHHVFRADPKSPPAILSIVFLAAVLATLPVLAGAVRSLSV